jgi:hypothetical protein
MAKAKTAKKAATAETTTDSGSVDNQVQRLNDAIAEDIAQNKVAKQSGATVATTFDDVFQGFNWTLFKGNASAESCGMHKDEFKLVKITRTNYRDAWNAAELPNFDQRWKYVVECSKHYVPPTDADKQSRGKSTEAKLEEAVRSVLRHANTLGDETMIDFGTQMCDHLGLEIKDEE